MSAAAKKDATSRTTRRRTPANLDFRDSKSVQSNPGSGITRKGGNRDGASSLSQALQALEAGNNERLQRAAVKRGLRTRTLTLYEAFDHEAAKGITVSCLMECVPYLTPDKIATILLIARIGYARKVGRLRPIDRFRIMTLLADRHPGVKVRP